MTKVDKKLSSARKMAKKEAKSERQMKYEWVFMNGKQVRIERQKNIDGMSTDEFIKNNADPIWLHQNEIYDIPEPEG